jgi:hypothetical protein
LNSAIGAFFSRNDDDTTGETSKTSPAMGLIARQLRQQPARHTHAALTEAVAIGRGEAIVVGACDCF